jgi:hypothetical protein
MATVNEREHLLNYQNHLARERNGKMSKETSERYNGPIVKQICTLPRSQDNDASVVVLYSDGTIYKKGLIGPREWEKIKLPHEVGMK